MSLSLVGDTGLAGSSSEEGFISGAVAFAEALGVGVVVGATEFVGVVLLLVVAGGCDATQFNC